ncbi:TetR/AcrR family transcriptional regulator [Micromonospora chalcea]|uniref:TetR/AcrR family transcriptional regulator n=1 Tax=Micromonospora chalcea TaxID=1874 RepID=UPI001656DBAA|nr:TetR/AcrR family transcriptional regulator [Micromonospora chalcea]MBC8991452.1 TetR/AcrR family transcriptional regulator [Micromonospora chalcea]
MTSPRQGTAPPTAVEPTGGRGKRSDARRNRDRLLEAARQALSSGEGGFVLEAVARDAGVGIGTLYRHFPTRERLIEAVYASEVDLLIGRAVALLEQMPARDALRAWLEQFTQFAAAKRGMLDALRTEALAAAEEVERSGVRERITAAIAPILAAGACDGSLRADVQARDVVALVAGALLPAQVDAAQTQRILGLVLDALRPH